MKKSVILLELIISILILSIVGIYSLLFINNLYTTNTQNLKLLNIKLDLNTTSLFLENLLQNSVQIKTNSNIISFFEVNTHDFKNKNYSGFAVLSSSNKKFILTPFSKITKIKSKYIWFYNNYRYEIKSSFEDDKIYFNDEIKEKRIYEQYKLLNAQSMIYLENENLYFNNHLLLEGVHSFEAKILEKILSINICTRICEDWLISL